MVLILPLTDVLVAKADRNCLDCGKAYACCSCHCPSALHRQTCQPHSLTFDKHTNDVAQGAGSDLEHVRQLTCFMADRSFLKHAKTEPVQGKTKKHA